MGAFLRDGCYSEGTLKGPSLVRHASGGGKLGFAHGLYSFHVGQRHRKSKTDRQMCSC